MLLLLLLLVTLALGPSRRSVPCHGVQACFLPACLPAADVPPDAAVTYSCPCPAAVFPREPLPVLVVVDVLLSCLRSSHTRTLAHRVLSKVRAGREAKTWILAGNLFVKTRSEAAKRLIARGEQG